MQCLYEASRQITCKVDRWRNKTKVPEKVTHKSVIQCRGSRLHVYPPENFRFLFPQHAILSGNVPLKAKRGNVIEDRSEALLHLERASITGAAKIYTGLQTQHAPLIRSSITQWDTEAPEGRQTIELKTCERKKTQVKAEVPLKAASVWTKQTARQQPHTQNRRRKSAHCQTARNDLYNL